MYPYGMINNIHISRPGQCAFVEYATREMAEHAATQLYNNLTINNHSITLNWSKPKSAGIDSEESSKNQQDKLTMLPPPGMANAPLSAYSSTHSSTVQPVYIPPPPNMPPPLSSTSTTEMAADSTTATASVTDTNNIADTTASTAATTTGKGGAGGKRVATREDGRGPNKKRASAQAASYPSTDPTRLGAAAL